MKSLFNSTGTGTDTKYIKIANLACGTGRQGRAVHVVTVNLE
jgi:hypothetical protein